MNDDVMSAAMKPDQLPSSELSPVSTRSISPAATSGCFSVFDGAASLVSDELPLARFRLSIKKVYNIDKNRNRGDRLRRSLFVMPTDHDLCRSHQNQEIPQRYRIVEMFSARTLDLTSLRFVERMTNEKQSYFLK